MTGRAPTPRDLRAYARSTQARLLGGALLLLFTVGVGLIYVFYGPGGAALAFLCLLGSLLPMALVVIGLWIIDAIARRGRNGEGPP